MVGPQTLRLQGIPIFWPYEQREYLPRGKRDKHQDTEERRDAKVSCAVLEQR